VTRCLVSAPLYGRCLLVEANLCVNCNGPDAERIDPQLARIARGCQGLGDTGFEGALLSVGPQLQAQV